MQVEVNGVDGEKYIAELNKLGITNLGELQAWVREQKKSSAAPATSAAKATTVAAAPAVAAPEEPAAKRQKSWFMPSWPMPSWSMPSWSAGK